MPGMRPTKKIAKLEQDLQEVLEKSKETVKEVEG